MATQQQTTTETALEAARRLAPMARELAAETESGGRLPERLVAAMREAGLFHALLPREYGGLEIDPVNAARIVEIVSAGDGSAGWCVMLAAQSCSFAGLMPPEHAKEIWGSGAIVAGTANPGGGRAVWTETPEPGYIVSGRWGFASGSSHADWFTGECRVFDGEEPRLDANGNEVTRAVFVPRSEVTTYETWNVTGLRGTASNDFTIDNAFVPASRGFQMLVDAPKHPWAVYRTEPLIFINHGAQALGVARGALESAEEIARRKRGWGGVPLIETARIQSAYAQAAAMIDSAACYLYDTAQQLWESALRGETDTNLRARTRLATSNAATMSVRAVDLLHEALGTQSIFASNPIERQFRDIHTATKHVMIGHMTYEAAGRVLLGQEPQFPFF